MFTENYLAYPVFGTTIKNKWIQGSYLVLTPITIISSLSINKLHEESLLFNLMECQVQWSIF